MHFARSTAIVITLLTLMESAPALAAEVHHTLRFYNRAGRPRTLSTMGFSPDGSLLAIAPAWDNVKLIRTETGEIVDECRFGAADMAFARSGQYLLMVNGSTQRLYDVRRQRTFNVSLEPESGVLGLRYQFKNGKWLVAEVLAGGPAAKSQKIQPGDEVLGIGVGKEGPITDLRGRSQYDFMRRIQGTLGDYARLQVIPAGRIQPEIVPMQRYALRTERGKAIFVAPQRQAIRDTVLAVFLKTGFRFVDAASGKQVGQLNMQSIRFPGLQAVSGDGKSFAVLGDTDEGEAVEIYDVASGERRRIVKLPRWEVPSLRGLMCYDMVFTPDDKQLLIGTWDRVQTLNVANGELETPLAVDDGQRRTRKRSKARFTHLTAVADQIGVERSNVSFGKRAVHKLAVSPQGVVATGDSYGNVKLWTLRDGTKLHQLPVLQGEDKEIEGLAFSPDGRWLAYFVQGTLHVVNVADFTPEHPSAAPDQTLRSSASAAPQGNSRD